MFLIFAVIFGGILSGRLLRGRRLGFVQPAITAIIWLLLFLLGVEVGSDPEVVGGLATLGVAALAVFTCSVVGSIAASWLLWRRIRRHRSGGTAKPAGEDDGDGGPAGESSGQSMWAALKGSLVIVAFFVAGSLVGLFTPFNVAGTGISTWVLYALMFCVGITLGHEPRWPAVSGNSIRAWPCCLSPRLSARCSVLPSRRSCCPGVWPTRWPSAPGSDTIRFRVFSLRTSGVPSWLPLPCSATSCVRSSPCLPLPLSPAFSARWPPCRSAEPRPSIRPCRSSPGRPDGPMPWSRSSTGARWISACRSW